MMRVVDSRSDYRIKLINIKFSNPLWLSSIDEVFVFKKTIDLIYNPKGITVDDCVLWMLKNNPYSSKQTSPKTIRCKNHLELINNSIDTDAEGTYDD